MSDAQGNAATQQQLGPDANSYQRQQDPQNGAKDSTTAVSHHFKHKIKGV